MADTKIQEAVKQNVEHCYVMKKVYYGVISMNLALDWTQLEIQAQFSKKISNNYLDEIYDHAIAHGALGGKLLGAGGGGYFMFYVTPSLRNSFLSAMQKRGFNQTLFNFDHHGLRSWSIRDLSG